MKSQVVIFLILIALGWRCTNPFTTRDVELPDNSQGADTYFSPTDPATVFANFKYALEEKNEFNYMSCLSDTSQSGALPFLFVPDRTVQWQKLQNWQRSDERNYINKVFKESSQITFTYITDPDPQSINNTIDQAETRFFVYELKIVSDIEIVYTGKARMKLIKDEVSLWSVYYWEDARDEDGNELTWSQLKSDYKN